MKNKMKLGMCSALLFGGLACGTLGTNDLVAHASSNTINMNVAQQEGSQFTDVKADHWAYESIHWAQSKGIISGYGDGRFGPNDAVTEAQFVKMITNYLGIKDDYGNIVKTTKASHWSDSAYDAIAKHGVPLNGYFDNTVRNKPMKRGLVAQVITHLVGYKTDLEGSIEFLLDNKITAGQNPQFKDKDLYQFFGTGNTLSRSQVVAFLHRLETEKLNNLSESVEKPNGKSLTEIATTGKKRVDNSISQGATNKVDTTNTTTNKGSGFTPNGGGNVQKPPVETKPVANKVSERFIDNIKDGYEYYTPLDDEFTIMGPNKDGKLKFVFSYSDNVEKKLGAAPGSILYHTERIDIGTSFYKDYKKYITSLVLNSGFELTADEITPLC